MAVLRTCPEKLAHFLGDTGRHPGAGVVARSSVVGTARRVGGPSGPRRGFLGYRAVSIRNQARGSAVRSPRLTAASRAMNAITIMP